MEYQRVMMTKIAALVKEEHPSSALLDEESQRLT